MVYKSIIDGLEYTSYYRDEDIECVFYPLLNKLIDIRKKKGSRLIVMLSAPPGTGKSALCDFLVYLSKSMNSPYSFGSVGIDGFHYSNDYLRTHFSVRNGETIPLSKIKGSSITFDTKKLYHKILKTKNFPVVSWPKYSRVAHEPIENAIDISQDILLLEGNYLALKDDEWTRIRSLSDYNIRIIANVNQLKERLLKRRCQSGYDKEESMIAIEYNDVYNIHQCLKESTETELIYSLDISQDSPHYILQEKTI